MCPNFLFLNRGDGTFEDLTESSGAAASESGTFQAGMGVDAEDLTGDGLPELFVTHFRDDYGFPKHHLFPQIQRLARRWIDEGYLVTKGVPIGAILYQEQLARAAQKIDIACTRGGGGWRWA